MAASHEVVTVVIVDTVTIEVISCERGGSRFFFWRTIEDGQIKFTDKSLWDTAATALDKAMEYVLPDMGVRIVPEPDAMDFELLNSLLLWDTPDGPVSSLYEAVLWRDTLIDGMKKLEEMEDAAEKEFANIRGFLAAQENAPFELCRAAELLHTISIKQFELAKFANDREIKTLTVFIENFLGKRG